MNIRLQHFTPCDILPHWMYILTTPTEDGQHFHTHIICCLEEIDETTDKVHTKLLYINQMMN